MDSDVELLNRDDLWTLVKQISRMMEHLPQGEWLMVYENIGPDRCSNCGRKTGGDKCYCHPIYDE